MVNACGSSEVVLDCALADKARLLQLNDTLVVNLGILSISLNLCLSAICRSTIWAELLERDDSLRGVAVIESLLVNTLLFPVHIELGLLALELIE